MGGVKKAGRKKTRVLKLDEVWVVDFLKANNLVEQRYAYWRKALGIECSYKVHPTTKRSRAVMKKSQARAILRGIFNYHHKREAAYDIRSAQRDALAA